MPSEDAKTVKKEEVEDDDEMAIGSLMKKKASNVTPKQAKPKPKKEEAKNVKKEEADEDYEKPSTKKVTKKTPVKVFI